MHGFIQGEDRFQATLFPECLDDYVAEDSAVRVIDVFIDELDLSGLCLGDGGLCLGVIEQGGCVKKQEPHSPETVTGMSST